MFMISYVLRVSKSWCSCIQSISSWQAELVDDAEDIGHQEATSGGMNTININHHDMVISQSYESEL